MKKKKIKLALKNNSINMEINTLKRELSRCTIIAGKICLANQIIKLGGTKEDILEAEVKQVKKIVDEQRKSTYKLFINLYKDIAYDDRQKISLNVLIKDYKQFFYKNYGKVLTFFHAPSDMCRLFYIFNSSYYNNNYPYQYFVFLKDIVGQLSFIDFTFLISLIDYKNCECHNFMYYDTFNSIKIDKFWYDENIIKEIDKKDLTVCPKCGAILDYQEKFDKNNKAHICEECGVALVNPSNKDKLKHKDIVWICDKCGDLLNNQKGFTDMKGTWKCTKCGFKNNVTEDNIK